MELTEGRKVESIFFSDESELKLGGRIIDMRITMEKGQMALVPWIKVQYRDEGTRVFNASAIEGITLPKEV